VGFPGTITLFVSQCTVQVTVYRSAYYYPFFGPLPYLSHSAQYK